MESIPCLDYYPKTVHLRDETKITLRPLESGDAPQLLEFFRRVPEEERYYLKDNVAAPEVNKEWTGNLDPDRVVPIVACVGKNIVADATLHRSRALARRHVGELRVVVDPAYREVGLGRRLIRELLDIASDVGLSLATFDLVEGRERPAITAAESVGFREVATLSKHIRDFWGNYQEVLMLEMPVEERHLWRFESRCQRESGLEALFIINFNSGARGPPPDARPWQDFNWPKEEESCTGKS